MSDGDGWRADVGRGGLRLILLRGALVGGLLLALVALMSSARPAQTNLALAAGAVTLAIGVVVTGLAEAAARRRGWTVQRGCDLVVVVSTLNAVCAAAQFTYAEAAIAAGPQAGYAALTAWATADELGLVLLQGLVLWGLPGGLMTFASIELTDIARLRPAIVIVSVLTCFGCTVGLVLLTGAFALATRLDARFQVQRRGPTP